MWWWEGLKIKDCGQQVAQFVGLRRQAQAQTQEAKVETWKMNLDMTI